MRAAAIGVVAAVGCGSQPPAPIAHHAPVVPAKPLLAQPLVHRRLTVGTRASRAHRLTWELKIEGDMATLVETEQLAPGAVALARVNEAAWKTTRMHARRGSVEREADRLVLALESDTAIVLVCQQRELEVATPGALRVARPGHERDCEDSGMWSPSTTLRVDALVCTLAGEPSDPELEWKFAAAPGIEKVLVNDHCLVSLGWRVAASGVR